MENKISKITCEYCGKKIPESYLENTIMIPEMLNIPEKGYAHKRCYKKAKNQQCPSCKSKDLQQINKIWLCNDCKTWWEW